jgi:outer membrane protein TolC
MKNILFLLLITGSIQAQNTADAVISLGEFLGYVKKFHPIVKQANLIIDESDAKLMKARGAFDPQIEIDYSKKEFKEKEYYNNLNTTFKIPVWYGLDIKTNFENNNGLYLNPENKLPNNGLYAAGVSLSIGKNMFINQRMAQLKQAKNYEKQAQAIQKITVNKILYNAAITYFTWVKNYNERKVYKDFVQNAETRFKNIVKTFELGDRPAIDTLEAKILLDTRKLNYEKAKIRFVKSTWELSNYLWLKNNIPVEIKNTIQPDINIEDKIDSYLEISVFERETYNLNKHPELQSLGYIINNLSIEKRLKKNNLLPKIELDYNFLYENTNELNNITNNNYKAVLALKFPVFLRKERADFKLAELKLQEKNYEQFTTQLKLQNQLRSVIQELQSIQIQYKMTNDIVKLHENLVNAEERKFFLGESSLFLVNSRESKLIELQLKANQTQNNLLNTKAKLFNTLVR